MSLNMIPILKFVLKVFFFIYLFLFFIYLCSSRANWGLDFNNRADFNNFNLIRATAPNEHRFHCSPLLLHQIQNSEVSQEVKLRSLKAETTHKAGDEGAGTLSVIRVTKINTTSFITGFSLLCMQLHNTGTAVKNVPYLHLQETPTEATKKPERNL